MINDQWVFSDSPPLGLNKLLVTLLIAIAGLLSIFVIVLEWIFETLRYLKIHPRCQGGQKKMRNIWWGGRCQKGWLWEFFLVRKYFFLCHLFPSLVMKYPFSHWLYHKKDPNIPNEPLKGPKYWFNCPSSTLIEYRYIENALICSD